MSINTKGCNTGSSYKNMFIYMLRLMVAVAVLLPAKALSATTPQATYYVDPTNGNDGNRGTSRARAFRTIEKARNVARTINSNMTGDIYIYLRGGTYQLNSTLIFTNADRGTNGYNIIYSAYNGEKPVISGGKPITGWSLHDSSLNIYKAYAGGNIDTRQLYVNGKRATRARGTVSPSGLTFLIDSGYSANGKVFVDNAKPMDQWKNLHDIEFTYNCEFAAPRAIVDTIIYDGSTTKINMRNPVWYNATHKGGSSIGREHNVNGRIWYMENAYELLDAEGEWYLNRNTDTFYYKPKLGENIATSEVIAPVLEELVRIQGADLDHKAGNIRFKGITFAHATYMRPNIVGGVSDAQNNVMREYLPNNEEFLMGAAVNLKYANSVVFERSVFEHLGGIGLNMYTGSQDNLVVGCRFTDISAGGIAVGDYLKYYEASSENYMLNSDTRAILRNNDIINNYFKTGAEFFSSCAISSTHPVDMDIIHNEVSYSPYSGIHIGWGWHTGTASNIKNLKIEKNFIHDVNSILNDGGGIYTNGKTGGNATDKAGYFNENYVMNVYKSKGYALYNDEAGDASTWYAWKKNVVNYAARWAFQWRNSNNSWDSTYTNVSAAVVNTAKNPITNTILVSGTNWPAEAQAIIKNAGLEDEYLDIIPNDVSPCTSMKILMP